MSPMTPGEARGLFGGFGGGGLLYGIQIVYDEAAIVLDHWLFPYDRYIEYGPEDVAWASRLGFGHGVYKPGMYKVGNRFIVHPSLKGALEKQLKAK